MSSNPMDREIARLFAEGQAAARRGDRAMARTLLTQLVDRDPHNEEAWMWLSGVVTEPAEQQICLENALVINPYNAQARKGLEFLVTKTGTPSRVPAQPTVPEAPQAAEADMATASDNGEGPQSWAVPGPAPADPFVATAPYPAPDQAAHANGASTDQAHGVMDVMGAAGVISNMAGTVPYTAQQPAPTDVPFADGAAFNMPKAQDELTGPMDEAALAGMTSTNGNGNGNGNDNEIANSLHPEIDSGLLRLGSLSEHDVADAEPFVPPGMENVHLSNAQPAADFVPMQDRIGGDDTPADLPAWLEGLTPSAPAVDQSPQVQQVPQAPQENAYAPFDMSGFGSAASTPMGHMDATFDPNMPFGAPMPVAAPDAGHMGPYSDMGLPAPHELPGEDGRSGMGQSQPPSQPWYLQSSGANMAPPMPTGGISSYLDSSMLSGSSVGAAVMEGHREARSGATIQCPNCKEQVPETSLACPNCRYNFFVNCPHCHELVDTVDAMPGQIDTCPYCKNSINKMEMGLGGVTDLVSQKNPGARPAAAAAMSVPFPTMQQKVIAGAPVKRGLSFNWVIDLLWLIAVVLMVWALTQLPTWLNLPGMY